MFHLQRVSFWGSKNLMPTSLFWGYKYSITNDLVVKPSVFAEQSEENNTATTNAADDGVWWKMFFSGRPWTQIHSRINFNFSSRKDTGGGKCKQGDIIYKPYNCWASSKMTVGWEHIGTYWKMLFNLFQKYLSAKKLKNVKVAIEKSLGSHKSLSLVSLLPERESLLYSDQ